MFKKNYSNKQFKNKFKKFEIKIKIIGKNG